MPIVLGRREPRWPSPIVFGSGHYHELVSANGHFYFPGFANDDAAGYAIDFHGSNKINYLNASGAAITSGVWNGGLVAGDLVSSGGTTTAYWYRGSYMDPDDATDNKLHFLVADTTSNPKKIKLCNVDKAGTLVQFAWQDLGSGMSDGAGLTLQRDSSGNFVSLLDVVSGSHLARGLKMHWAASNGALTTSPLIPAVNTMGVDSGFTPEFGPTDNGIYMDMSTIGYQEAVSIGGGISGKLLNANTGRGHMALSFPPSMGRGPESSLGITGITITKGWYYRGFWAVDPSGVGNNKKYNIAEMNNFVDAMAREYGIL